MMRCTAMLAMALLLTAPRAVAQDVVPPGPRPPVPAAGPDVTQTLAAVEAAFEASVDAGAMTRRARRSSWLPEQVSVDLLLRDDRAVRVEDVVDSDLDDVGAYSGGDTRALWRDDVGDRVDVRLRVVWDLRGLVWPDDALRIADAQRRDRDALDDLREEALTWYHERWTARMLMLTTDTTPQERLELMASIEIATAHLDVLTDGWYRAALAGGSR